MIDLYFDYAAATPLDQGVLNAMLPFFAANFYNPSALYQSADDVRAKIESARTGVAAVLSCKSQEIVFTAGCTEANNLAIHGVMRRHAGKKIAVSAIEHDSVLSPSEQYERAIIPVLPSGIVDLNKLSMILDDPEIVLVSVMYANNEIGTVQPLREIAAIIQQKRKSRSAGEPLYFHTDAAQAPNYLKLSVHSLGVDLMSLNGGKMYGPKQSGCLYVAREIDLEPMIYGGGQERGLRSGTENVPQIIGFAEALKLASEMRDTETERLQTLQTTLANFCESAGGTVLGSKRERLPNNVAVMFSGIDNERMVMELDTRGMQIAAGSACHASASTMSTVLRAIGVNEQNSRTALRITMGRSTTTESIDQLIFALKELIIKTK